ILMQREDVILEWIFLPRKPNKKLKTYIEKISDLIHKDPGDWSKTAVSLYFIFPGICTLSLKMRTCGLLPGWYGSTSQDLLTALQMFQNPDQLQDNWLKDEASQTAPVKIGASS
ncbi:hypothetical protein STEG23_035509, partial [Scotinomys teguina]